MSILGGVNYYNSLRVVEKSIEKDTISALTQGSYMIDSRSEEINRLGRELSIDQRVKNLIYTRPKDDIEKVKLATAVRNGLLSYTILNDFIEDVYIYSKYSENITSSRALYSPIMFYESIYKFEGMTYEEFIRYIETPNYNRLELKPIYESGGKSVEKVIFLKSLPDSTDSLGTVIMVIGKEKYLNIISNAMKWDNSYYYIYNEKNELVTSNDHEGIYTTKIKDDLSSEVKSRTVNTQSGKVLEIKVSSSYNNWKYVAVIPYKAFVSQINSVRENTIFIIGVCIVVGFIISFLLANKNYRHIKNIVTFIKATYGSEEEEVDDYKLITQILKSSYKEIISNRSILENQLPLIKESYIKKLLQEEEEEDNESRTSKELLNINLDFKNYIVALFKINTSAEEINRSKNALDKFAIRSVVQEVFNEKFSGYISEIEDNTIAYICGFNDESEEKLEAELIESSKQSMIFSKDRLHISVDCGIGNVHKGYQHISKSYEEALEALNYSVFNNEGLTLYKNIRRSGKLFVYPVQKEVQLINFIKSGKKDQALKIVDALYEENCINNNLSCEMVKFFLFDLYCSIVKLLGEIKVSNNNPIFDIIKSYHEQNFSKRDALWILESIKNLISIICNMILQQRNENCSDLKEKILKYIDENYTDSQISLEEVADNFNITPQYLSKFFKENIGVNYLNYVNEKRINNAIEYLKRDEKVKDAAVKSGFDNIGTFINVFKKHVGVTPGEYKEKMGC
jgi:YesN/AraC family two-component response regulator